MSNELFNKLRALDVSAHVEKKDGGQGKLLSYLSWAWAWDEFKKNCPDATYTIYRNENGLPYVHDPATGYMVYTSVTAEGITHEMWLPVMNSSNNAMKDQPYDIKTKYSTKHVEPATMFDVNKTIMRCLVKNLAMFGLGLYLYAGEDLPADQEGDNAPTTVSATKAVNEPSAPAPSASEASVNLTLASGTDQAILDAIDDFKYLGGDIKKALIACHYTDINQVTLESWQKLVEIKKRSVQKKGA